MCAIRLSRRVGAPGRCRTQTGAPNGTLTMCALLLDSRSAHKLCSQTLSKQHLQGHHLAKSQSIHHALRTALGGDRPRTPDRNNRRCRAHLSAIATAARCRLAHADLSRQPESIVPGDAHPQARTGLGESRGRHDRIAQSQSRTGSADTPRQTFIHCTCCDSCSFTERRIWPQRRNRSLAHSRISRNLRAAVARDSTESSCDRHSPRHRSCSSAVPLTVHRYA